jgi:hypothetical protein
MRVGAFRKGGCTKAQLQRTQFFFWVTPLKFCENPIPHGATNMDAQSTILIPLREGSEGMKKKNFGKLTTRTFVRVAKFFPRFPRVPKEFPRVPRLFPRVPKK